MSNLSTTIKVDTNGFQKQINDAKASIDKFNQSIKQSGSSVTSVNSGQVAAFERVVKSLGKVTDGSKTVTQQQKILKDTIQDLTSQWSNLDNAAKSSSFGQSLSDTLSVAKTTLKDLSEQIRATKEELKSFTEEGAKSSTSGLDASTSKSSAAMSKLSDVMSKAGFGNVAKGVDMVSGAFSGMGAKAVVGATGVGAVALAAKEAVSFTKEAIDKSAAFGEALSQLSAITGVSGKDLDTLRGNIQNIAKDTNSSVTDVTNSMAKIGGAMPSLLNDTEALGEVYTQTSTLAKAGLMDMDDATQALTTVMGQFNIEADGAASVVDILANASQAGSAEISDLSETAKVAGTAAAGAGIQINEMAAMAEVLGDKALKGSEAGTQMRNIFAKMSSEGIQGASAVMEELGKHAGDTAYMVKEFGVQNMNAANILAEGGSRYEELIKELDKTGTASEMAATNTNNLKGKIAAMQTQWENFMASFDVDDENGAVMQITESIGNLVSESIEMFKSFSQNEMLAATFDTLGNAVSGCVDIISVIIDIITDCIDITNALLNPLELGTKSFTGINKVIDLVVGAFKTLGVVCKAIKVMFVMFTDSVKSAKGHLLKMWDALKMQMADIPILKKCMTWLKTCISWINQFKKTWNDTIGQVVGYINKLDAKQKGIVKETTKTRKKLSTEPKVAITGKHSPQDGGTNKNKTIKSKMASEDNSYLGKLEAKLKKIEEKRAKLGVEVKQSDIDTINKEIEDLKKKIQAHKIRLGIEKPEEGFTYISQLEDKIAKLKEKRATFSFETPQADIDAINSEIDTLEERLRNIKIHIGVDDSLDKVNTEADKVLESIASKNQSSFEKFVPKQKGQDKEVKTLQDSIDKHKEELGIIQDQMDTNDDLISKLEEVIKKYEELGETGCDAYQNVVDKQNDLLGENRKLAKRGKKVVNQLDKETEAQEKFNEKQEHMESAQTVVDGLGSSFNALGNAIGGTTGEILSMMGAQMQAVAEMIPQIMSLTSAKQGDAMAGAIESGSSEPWPMNIIAIATGVAAVISAFANIGSYADGGIISAASMIGDKNIARVNGGEMILNGTQQSKLFNILNGGGMYNMGANAQIALSTVKVKGSDLYLALKNYNKLSPNKKTL